MQVKAITNFSEFTLTCKYCTLLKNDVLSPEISKDICSRTKRLHSLTVHNIEQVPLIATIKIHCI